MLTNCFKDKIQHTFTSSTLMYFQINTCFWLKVEWKRAAKATLVATRNNIIYLLSSWLSGCFDFTLALLCCLNIWKKYSYKDIKFNIQYLVQFYTALTYSSQYYMFKTKQFETPDKLYEIIKMLYSFFSMTTYFCKLSPCLQCL